MVRLARLMGARRIVSGAAIPHPLGDPRLSPEAEKDLRRSLVREALALLASPE
jgi:glycine reductase